MIDERKILNDLRCCTISGERDCANCTQTNWLSCRDSLMRGALELIESQRAEIERLRGYDKHIAKAKVTAIKEFAETLWDKLICNAEVTYDLPDDFCVDVFDENQTSVIIDDLVKKMTEGENNA